MQYPFPIQAATLPEAIGGRDVLGKGQTGSGKTLAFGLTLLTRLAFQRAESGSPLALILAPTRELAMQIDAVLNIYAFEVGLSSTVLAGGMPYPPQMQALRKGVPIVVATPGRLQDHLKRGTINLSETKIVVLDEADQMADMGFLPVVTEVLALTPQNGQRLLFSATLDRDVDKLVKKFMKNPVTHEIAVSTERHDDMDHHVLVVDSHVKDDVIAQIASREGRTIFFVRTKHGADRLTEKLRKQGVDAGVLHGGRTQKQRMRVLDAFKIGKKRTLIATDVAARGIHVDDVSLVVHVDPPETHKDYLHRAGRTARAGAKGTVVSLTTSGNRKRVHNLGRDAGVKMTETRVESMHPDLMRITGAQEPSGIPVSEESPQRSERSKPGRKKPERSQDRRSKTETRERSKRKPKTEVKHEKKHEKKQEKKPDRDALRRKDRASKKFDSRIEKRVVREEPKSEEKKPNRIARRAHLQPAGRVVQSRSSKRKKGPAKGKQKARSRAVK